MLLLSLMLGYRNLYIMWEHHKKVTELLWGTLTGTLTKCGAIELHY